MGYISHPTLSSRDMIIGGLHQRVKQLYLINRIVLIFCNITEQFTWAQQWIPFGITMVLATTSFGIQDLLMERLFGMTLLRQLHGTGLVQLKWMALTWPRSHLSFKWTTDKTLSEAPHSPLRWTWQITYYPLTISTQSWLVWTMLRRVEHHLAEPSPYRDKRLPRLLLERESPPKTTSLPMAWL